MDLLKSLKLISLAAVLCGSMLFAQTGIRDTVENSEGDTVISDDELASDSVGLGLDGSSSGGAILEPVDVEEVDEIKNEYYSDFDARKSGNKFGVAFGVSWRLGGTPVMLQGYSLEVPFARIWSASFSVAQNTMAIDSYTDTENSIDISSGSGSLEYLEVMMGARFYAKILKARIPIGFGFVYDKFLKGYIDVIDATESASTVANSYGGTVYNSVKINSSDSLLSLYASIGYPAEIKENVYVLPEVKALFSWGQMLPSWNSSSFGFTLHASIALGFKM